MYVVNTSSTRYNVVRDAALELGWAIEDDQRKPTVLERYRKESEQRSINIFEVPAGAKGAMTTTTRTPASGPSQTKRMSSADARSAGVGASRLSIPSTETSGEENVSSSNEDSEEDSAAALQCGMTVAQERYLWRKFGGRVFAGSGTALLRKRSASSSVGGDADNRKPTQSGRASSRPPGMPVPRAMSSTKRGGARAYDPTVHNQIYWTDMSVLPDRVSFMKPHQRLNHFPDMHLICRKMTLFIRLMKLRKAFEKIEGPYYRYLHFFPMSWSTKDGSNEKRQLEEFVLDLQRRKKFKTFIMKPNTGCQGKGILITRNPIAEMALGNTSSGNRKGSSDSTQSEVRYDPKQEYVVQLYVHRPLLIEGRKFDLRVYVLITSLSNPSPQIFVHKEGLIRLASEPYSRPFAAKRRRGAKGDGNTAGLTAHLTNYAVSKAKIREIQQKAVQAGEGAPSAKMKGASGVPHAPENQSDDNAMFKKDFTFLEEFVDANCKRWVEPKPTVAPADGSASESDDCEGREGDGPLPSGTRRRSTGSGPSINSTPLELCPGISPFHFLIQQIDRAVVISVLSALPELQRSLNGASVRGSTTSAPCLALANSLTLAHGTPTERSPDVASLPPRAASRPASSSAFAGSTLPGGGLAPYLSTRDGRSCFELLGYDVLIRDADGRVDIMEINHSPSLFCDSPFDQKIKQKVVSDTFRILKPQMLPTKKTSAGSDLSYLNDVVLNPKAHRGMWDVMGCGGSQFRQVHPVPNSITDSERMKGEEVAFRVLAAGGVQEEVSTTPTAQYGRPFLMHAETSPLDSFDPFCSADVKARLKKSIQISPQLGVTYDVLYTLTKEYCGGSTVSGQDRAQLHAERLKQLGRELGPHASVIKYDPNAGHLCADPSYTPYPHYCLWLRHLYDSIMVLTGVATGY